MAFDAREGKSASSILREWMRDRISTLGEAKVGPLADEAVQFLADDQEMLNQFVSERVYDTAAEMVRAVILETRRIKRFYEAAATTPAEQQERVQRWFNRMEHQPIRNSYLRLRLMTKEDLLAGAREREVRGGIELGMARWYRILAAGMAETQTVADVYTPDQVSAAYESAQTTVQNNLDLLMTGIEETLRNIMGENDTDSGTTTNPES